MTFNNKEASEKLAELYDIEHIVRNRIKSVQLAGKLVEVIAIQYITQDMLTMTTLAIDNEIDILNLPKFCWCVSNVYDNKEYHKDHADKYEAARVAIAKALIKLKE